MGDKEQTEVQKPDVFRKTYKELSPETAKFIEFVKYAAEGMYKLLEDAATPNNMREIALAKTKLEESVMWVVKGLTK